jgi:hypothetical protein
MTVTSSAAWPSLPLADWEPTYATLHRWTQIVGKTRLALAPMQNHWWHVTLYLTARGLTTLPMPYGDRTLDVEFDFVDHMLVLRTSDGATRTLPLVEQSVADFYREYRALLRSLNVEVRIHGAPNEIPDATPFAKDTVHASYDPDAANRCWRILASTDRVLKEFRGKFVGKSSPSHFWWGSFDLACTRFSGRPAPTHPGGIPNIPDYVTREAYSRECISAGWWPGMPGSPVAEPVFYAYAYPEPPGCPDAPIQPVAASYAPSMREWLLPYEAVRQSADPNGMLLEFLESTYATAATLGGWDRAALERADTRITS